MPTLPREWYLPAMRTQTHDPRTAPGIGRVRILHEDHGVRTTLRSRETGRVPWPAQRALEPSQILQRDLENPQIKQSEIA